GSDGPGGSQEAGGRVRPYGADGVDDRGALAGAESHVEQAGRDRARPSVRFGVGDLAVALAGLLAESDPVRECPHDLVEALEVALGGRSGEGLARGPSNRHDPSLMEIGRLRWYSSPKAWPARAEAAPTPMILLKSPLRFVLLALGLALFAGCRGGSQQKPGARENAASPPAPPPRTATPAPDRL